MKRIPSKTMLAVNLTMIAAIFALNYFYQSNGFAFTLKCVCSIGFAVLGLINLAYALALGRENRKFYLGMALGLVLAMLGDVLIGYNFILGAGVFALGHICFLAAYCFLQRLHWRDIAAGGLLFLGALLFLLLCPLLSFQDPALKMVCIGYALIISCMLGKALGNFLGKRDLFYGLLALGSGLFFFSDLMLVLDQFIGLWAWTNEACMGAYYPALCTLAFSMYIKTREGK